MRRYDQQPEIMGERKRKDIKARAREARREAKVDSMRDIADGEREGSVREANRLVGKTCAAAEGEKGRGWPRRAPC